jgi:hypothetical protein
MVCFQTKYPNLGKFWKGHAMDNLGIFCDYFRAIVIFLWQFGIFCGNLDREKSGNPGTDFKIQALFRDLSIPVLIMKNFVVSYWVLVSYSFLDVTPSEL